MSNEIFDFPKGHIDSQEPPEGVLAGEDVPRENEEDEYEKILEEMKERRARMLDKKAFGESFTEEKDKEVSY